MPPPGLCTGAALLAGGAYRAVGTPGARGAAGRDTDLAWAGGARVVPGAGPRGGGEGSVGGAGPRGGGAGAGRAHVTAAPLAGAGRGGAAGQRREAAGTAGRSVRCRCCCCSATATGGSGSGAGSGAGGAGPGMHNARPDELGADRVSVAAGTGRERDHRAPAPPLGDCGTAVTYGRCR